MSDKNTYSFAKYIEVNFNTYITILIMIMMIFSFIVSLIRPTFHRP